MMKRVVAVLNGRASGGHSPVQEALSVFRDLGVSIDEHRPETIDGLRGVIRERGPKADAVLVGGGDGTVNAALAPVLRCGVPLGVLPMGTANDFARTLGIPNNLRDACQALAAGCCGVVDVGLANGQPFVNAAGMGLSTRVARALSRDTKGRLGWLSYPAAVLASVRDQRPFRAEIAGDNGDVRVTSIQLTIGNGVYYGGGTPLADDASIRDGELDLYNVRALPLERLLRVAFAIRRGSQRQLEDGVDTLRGRRFRIDTQPSVTVSLDGEPLLRTPVEFSVAPGALRVLIPPGQVQAPELRSA